MTALSRRRRRNTFLALGAGILAAVLAPTLLYVGAKAITNSKAGINALADAPPEQAFPATPTAMLATVDAANELTSVTVLVLAPDADVTAAGYDQRGGSVVSLPINVNSGSGEQLLSLHDAYALGGEEELRADLETAISLTIDYSRVMTAQEFTAFLGGLPALQITLPRDVLGSDETAIYAKGPAVLTATQAAQIITSNSPTESELLRQPNIDALWSGISGAVGAGRTGQALSATTPTTFDEMAARLTAGPVAARGLVARPLDVVVNPEGLDIQGLDRTDTILVFASIAPAQMTRPAGGLSYRLEAPPGYDQQVRKTIGILLSFDNNVVSVDLNAEPRDETTYLMYDSALAEAEPTENAVFGTIKIETPDVRLAGVDVTIALGTTYLDGVDLSAPDATSSTSSSVALESVEPIETTA
jgi:hypothetical protein